MPKPNDFLDMDLKNSFQMGEDPSNGPIPTMDQCTDGVAQAKLTPNRFVEPCKVDKKAIKLKNQRAW